MHRLILALIPALCLITAAYATDVSGPVSGTWTEASSPYNVIGELSIPAGQMLTIEPGVQVVFQGYYKFLIYGSLQAVGAPGDSIIFTATDHVVGYHGLHFMNINSQSDSSFLVYCSISYCRAANDTASANRHGGALYCDHASNLRIERCSFSNNNTAVITGTPGTPGTSTYPNGGPGQSVISGNGGGIYLSYSDVLILNCVFAENRTGSVTGGAGGNGISGSNPGQTPGTGGSGGIGQSGRGGAIYATNSHPYIANCRFHDNYTGMATGGHGGNGGGCTANGSYYAVGKAGGAGGAGISGSGVVICFDAPLLEPPYSVLENNLFFDNHSGNGTGGAGGSGGMGYNEDSPARGTGGNGGNGGAGTGGNGSALFYFVGGSGANLTIRQNSAGPATGGQGGFGGWGSGFSGNPGLPGLATPGQAAIYCAGTPLPSITNSIVRQNTGGMFTGNPPTTYSCLESAYPGTGNIAVDPLFVLGPGGSSYLSQVSAGQTLNSPCLDAGDPASAMVIGTTRTDQVQDAGIVDMGFHYPMGLSWPNLDVTLTPINPPIVIPAQGGSFQFNASLANLGPDQWTFYAWTRIRFPDGTWSNPLLCPPPINPPVGVTITRQRTQNVPGTWMAGEYDYVGYVNLTQNYPALDSSFFTFTKSATANGEPAVWDALCYGELFPGEQSQTALIPSGLDLGVSPNPFNPTTALSYELRAASYVSLRVYDTAGRLVGTLMDGMQEAGQHSVTFDGSKLASGMYFVRLQAGDYTAVKKMMLMK